MKPSFVFCTKILQVLAGSDNLSCTLEELTNLAVPFSDGLRTKELPLVERSNQAAVLDALIVLSENGHIFLNPNNEQSCITIKGLLSIGDKAICN